MFCYFVDNWHSISIAEQKKFLYYDSFHVYSIHLLIKVMSQVILV